MLFSINRSINPWIVLRCGGGGGSTAPPPPPAPEEAAPVMFGSKDSDPSLLTKNSAKTGKKKLQIPLTQSGGDTGLGIPSP